MTQIQTSVKKWGLPKAMVAWVTVSLVLILLITILIVCLLMPSLIREQTVPELLSKNLSVPKDVTWSRHINLGGKSPINAVQDGVVFSYLDFSEGSPPKRLSSDNLPGGRAVITYIDEFASWTTLQTLFADLQCNSITRAFVACEEVRPLERLTGGSKRYAHVPIDIADGRKFSYHMLLELQGTGEVIDLTTGSIYKSDNDTTLLMECRGVMIMDENHAIIVSGNDEAMIGDFVRLYSNIQGVLPSGQRRMLFLKMPGFTPNLK